MTKLTDRHETWRRKGDMQTRFVNACVFLALFIAVNIFLMHPFGGYHYKNLFAARSGFISGLFSMWAIEFIMISLLMWNWSRLKSHFISFSLLCIFSALGVICVVAMFPLLVPVFHVPQAVLLTLLQGYLSLVAAIKIDPSIHHDARLGDVTPDAEVKAMILRLIFIFGCSLLVILYALLKDNENGATAIAYGTCVLLGGVCSWLVRLNIPDEA